MSGLTTADELIARLTDDEKEQVLRFGVISLMLFKDGVLQVFASGETQAADYPEYAAAIYDLVLVSYLASLDTVGGVQ